MLREELALLLGKGTSWAGLKQTRMMGMQQESSFYPSAARGSIMHSHTREPLNLPDVAAADPPSSAHPCSTSLWGWGRQSCPAQGLLRGVGLCLPMKFPR